MKVSRFEDLDCWKEARQLTRQVYEAIGRNPLWQKDVRLCRQIQAASVSVLSNIAEGFVRHSDKEFAQFLFIAMSSAAETQSHAYVALDQKYLSKESFDAIYSQAGKTSRIRKTHISKCTFEAAEVPSCRRHLCHRRNPC